VQKQKYLLTLSQAKSRQANAPRSEEERKFAGKWASVFPENFSFKITETLVSHALLQTVQTGTTKHCEILRNNNINKINKL